MKHYLLFIALFLNLTANANKEWVDITDDYITNPGFTGNVAKGWTYNWSAGNCNLRCNMMEFWNATYNISQTLSMLPKGHYRLSVQAFARNMSNNLGYRIYNNGDKSVTAELFAGEQAQSILSVYTHSYSTNLCGSSWYCTYNGMYYPNSMESASEAFSQGDYWNLLEFDYDGGDLNVGMRNTTWSSDCWSIFDNFRLEVYTDVVRATDLALDRQTATLTFGQTLQLHPTLSPADVTTKKLKWTSADEQVATVDDQGRVTAKGLGETTITVQTIDGTNLTAYCDITVRANDVAAGSLVINEVMSCNIDEYVSPAFNFDGWVEFYNPTNQSVSMSGLTLMDNKGHVWNTPVGMPVIAAHGYGVMWFDNNALSSTNAPFKLDVDGGTLTVINPQGKTVCDVTYPAGLQRASYALTSDGGSQWSYTSTPTPGGSNNRSVFAQKQLGAPVVDTDSRICTSSITVNVQIPAGTTLRYTTDGSLPTLTHGYTSVLGQFTVKNTTIYRFRLFADDYLASPTTTRTYIFNSNDFNLPVLSVVCDRNFLYGDSLGVMVRGVNGRPGNGQNSPCNWNMDWERPANMSYITTNNEMVLNQDVNLEMCGGWSRAWEPHSFKLKGDKELGGEKNLFYPFFQAKPYIRNRALQVRNGGNDNMCRIKDPALQTIIQTSGVDIDLQSYQPVHEFINGAYMGVLNVREPNSKQYAYANYGWDDDEIDQFEMSPDSGYVQKCGTKEAWDRLVQLSYDAANSETYAQICNMLDIDEFVNYNAMEFYMGSSDWVNNGNNLKGFRNRADGKFRFVSFDLDGALAFTTDVFNQFENNQIHAYNALMPSGEVITEEVEYITLFLNMLQNDQFRRRFIDTYCMMGGSVFESSRATAIIDSLTANVRQDMQIKNESPDGTANEIKWALANRMSMMMAGLQQYSRMKLGDESRISTMLRSNTAGANIYVNDVKVPTGRFEGQLFSPARIKAEAPAGYTFRGWINNSSANAYQYISPGSTWSYYDRGSLDGTGWQSRDYHGSNWKQGYAPFGFDKPGLNTTLDYGDDVNNKRITYYFRKSINLKQKPSAGDVCTFNFAVDDGLVVYVNGTEAGRYGMGSGPVTYETITPDYARNNPDEGTMNLPTSLFVSGTNYIAVEVHNCRAGSSDVYFDGSLTMTSTPEEQGYYTTQAEFDLPTSGSLNVTADFQPMTAAERAEAGITPVRINEISASNSVYINEYFKKNDFVELYNTTGEEQDVEGMYLTDNLEKMTKSKLTKGATNAVTKIAPHSHLVVWCDKLATTNRALHVDFKLAAEGGAVALTAADKSWTDIMHYGPHDGNSSVGRYPDGASDIYVMSRPTIEKPNLLTTYSTLTDQASLDIAPAFITSNGSLSINYAREMLRLRTEDATWAQVTITTASGQLIKSAAANFAGGYAVVPVSELPSGFYIAKAVDNHGNKVSCKFIR